MGQSRSFLAAALLSAALSVCAESLTYELYDVSDQASPVLLSKGVREYTVRDVLAQELGYGIGHTWSKEILVANGFSAGVTSFERDVAGFGLWLKDRESWRGRLSSGGFSWDWFYPESENVYRKLQGPGRVRATFTPAKQGERLTSVEVLEDITLRAKVRPWFLSFWADGDTHNMVVKKGSVLRFAP